MWKNMDTSILDHEEKIKSGMTETTNKTGKLANEDFLEPFNEDWMKNAGAYTKREVTIL